MQLFLEPLAGMAVWQGDQRVSGTSSEYRGWLGCLVEKAKRSMFMYEGWVAHLMEDAIIVHGK